MRIALCFSGMLRTHEKCLPTVVEHVVQANPEHEFHSFFATWDVNGKNPAWWNISTDHTPVDYAALIAHKQSLNIKSIQIDTFTESDFMKRVETDLVGKYRDHGGPKCTPQNVLPMIKKVDQAHRLMLENAANYVHYDIVVKLRADLFFESKIEFRTPEPKTVYMPERECWGPGSLNDQLIYGDGDTMSFHSSLFTNLDNVFGAGNTLHPESVLHSYYQVGGITVVRYPIAYHIER